MADKQIVDFDAMVRARTAFETAFTEADGAHKTMTTTINSLSTIWTGQAATPYSGAMETWLTNFGTVVTALGNMKTTLEAGTRAYQANEDESSAMASRISGDLQGLPGVPPTGGGPAEK